MSDYTIVGSGAAGIHVAQTLLEGGASVTLVDVGFAPPVLPLPETPFAALKEEMEDSVPFFLGEQFQSVVPPHNASEIYGFPPGKDYVFRSPAPLPTLCDGFEPLFSYARGGLAQAWTGGSYPYTEEDLALFPFGLDALKPHYETVAERIGLIGLHDDLSPFITDLDTYIEPLRLDPHSRKLQERYEKKKQRINRKGAYLGRSRIAVLSCARKGRGACDYSGRCIWGCPHDALYVPEITLRSLLDHPAFTYLPQRLVRHFSADGSGRVQGLTCTCLDNGQREDIPLNHLILAAGTLSSARILLESLALRGERNLTLNGLMDNRQILVPFVSPGLIGKPYPAESYQYHQLAMGLTGDTPEAYVHGQITTLKTALLQPVIQTMPVPFRSAIYVARNLHAAMGVVNLNFSDTRRPDNSLTLSPGDGDAPHTLSIRYRPPADEKKRIRRAMSRTRSFLASLGAIVPPGQSHIRPMGASVHYSGTLPMVDSPRQPFQLSREGLLYGFDNLTVADGSGLPFLPAKNLTFTLMANGVRIAHALLENHSRKKDS